LTDYRIVGQITNPPIPRQVGNLPYVHATVQTNCVLCAEFALFLGFRLKIHVAAIRSVLRPYSAPSFRPLAATGRQMNPTAPSHTFLTLLFSWSKARLIEQVGGEVARECHNQLWQRVRRQVAGMSVSEIRGYVRAHAAGIAAAEVEEVLDRRSLKSAMGARVLASSVDQLVSMAVRDALAEESSADARTLAA
jgi:hypothetical protein